MANDVFEKNLDRLERLVKKKAEQEQKEIDAKIIVDAHVHVLQIILLAEKDCWMPADTAQKLIDFLVQQIMENPADDDNHE